MNTYLIFDHNDKQYKVTSFASRYLVEQVWESIPSVYYVVKTIGYFSRWQYPTVDSIKSVIHLYE